MGYHRQNDSGEEFKCYSLAEFTTIVLVVVLVAFGSMVAAQAANQNGDTLRIVSRSSPTAAAAATTTTTTDQFKYDEEYRLPINLRTILESNATVPQCQQQTIRGDESSPASSQVSPAQRNSQISIKAATANKTRTLATTATRAYSAADSSLALEDLLAVESARLLTIGKQQANGTHQQQPLGAPYATSANLTTRANQTQRHQEAERQFVKLFRPLAPPVFLLQPYFNRVPHNIYQQQQQQQSHHHLLPVVATWPGVYLSTAPVSAASGKPVITTVSPPTWSSYSEFVNQTTVRFVNNTTVTGGIDERISVRKQNGTTTDSNIKVLDPIGVVGMRRPTNAQSQPSPSLLSSDTQTSGDQFDQQKQAINNKILSASNNQQQLNWTQLLRQASESNVMESLMVTNRSMVSLLCDTNDMLLRLKFKQPFHGIVMTNLDRRKACRLIGTGEKYYEMRVSLRDCGTRQEMPRLFINNIQIQFRDHKQSQDLWASFDVVDDEVKTIICSYPIRPRAPPPPELPAGLPERIVELTSPPETGGEPAKLVYYEPLILISGLLLLALLLLGLTTSAYMFSKRGTRSSRSATKGPVDSGSFTSSRLYRNSPAQMANNRPLMSPPVIEIQTDGDDEDKSLGIKQLELKQREHERQSQLSSRRRYGSVVEKYGPTSGRFLHTTTIPSESVGCKRVSASLPKSALKRQRDNFNVSVVNLKSKSTAADDSPDSLAADSKNEQASVTTIEIPFLPAKGRVESDEHGEVRHPLQLSTEPSGARRQREGPLNATASKSQQQYGRLPTLVPKKKTKGSPHAHRVSELPGSREQQQEAETPLEEPTTPKIKPMGAPRFGSLRATLTSPDEYRRLQEIARLFDEILIEKHVGKGKEGAVVVYDSRLCPSKYKSKIMSRMDERERRLAGEILSKDELFRSLVVESTSREVFHRKLRYNPVYGDNFSQGTWDLLEEILLDPEISSSESGSSSSSSSVVVAPNNREETSSDRPWSPQPRAPSGAKIEQRQQQKVKSGPVRREYQVIKDSNYLVDDNESVVAEVDTRQRELPNRQDSLNSPSSLSGDQALSVSPREVSDEKSLVLKTVLTEVSQRQEIKRLTREQDTQEQQQGQEEPLLRVSQFNSTKISRQVGGLADTLINIDSVTNFTSSEDFSTYTRSSIEHRRYESSQDTTTTMTAADSLPYVDEDERVGNYEYAKETFKMSPKLGSNQTAGRRLLLKRQPPTTTTTNNYKDPTPRKQSTGQKNR